LIIQNKSIHKYLATNARIWFPPG